MKAKKHPYYERNLLSLLRCALEKKGVSGSMPKANGSSETTTGSVSRGTPLSDRATVSGEMGRWTVGHLGQ